MPLRSGMVAGAHNGFASPAVCTWGATHVCPLTVKVWHSIYTTSTAFVAIYERGSNFRLRNRQLHINFSASLLKTCCNYVSAVCSQASPVKFSQRWKSVIDPHEIDPCDPQEWAAGTICALHQLRANTIVTHAPPCDHEGILNPLSISNTFYLIRFASGKKTLIRFSRPARSINRLFWFKYFVGFGLGWV